MALLAYVKDPELGEPFLEAITTYKVSIFWLDKFIEICWSFN
jgi:hypothetical protein